MMGIRMNTGFPEQIGNPPIPPSATPTHSPHSVIIPYSIIYLFQYIFHTEPYDKTTPWYT